MMAIPVMALLAQLTALETCTCTYSAVWSSF